MATKHTKKVRIKWGRLLLAVFVVAAGIAALFYFNPFGPKEPVLPPVRTGSTSMIARIPDYSLERAYNEADLVALVRVGDWLGERNVEYEAELTYYSARAERMYKGEETDFVLCQDGNSALTLSGYPLFTDGNELLLFLKHGSDPDYEDMYYIVGSYGTVMYALSDDSGETYLIEPFGGFGHSTGIKENHSEEAELIAQLVKNNGDRLLNETVLHAAFICKAEDMEKRMDELR